MITYINEISITEPIGNDNKLILQCVNDIGVMGAGVAKAIYQKWPIVKERYIEWKTKQNFKLGNIQLVNVERNTDSDTTYVVNMIGQHGIANNTSNTSNIPPIRYDAIELCLKQIKDIINCRKKEVSPRKKEISVHIPYLMGCGLAGGKWTIMENLINTTLSQKNVFIYDRFNQINQK